MNLLAARNGRLWIGTEDGLASWDGGNWLLRYPEIAGRQLSAIVEDHEGTIWVGTDSPGRLCAIRIANARCYWTGRQSLCRCIICVRGP